MANIKIGQIGTVIISNYIESISFFGNRNLLDFDVILIDSAQLFSDLRLTVGTERTEQRTESLAKNFESRIEEFKEFFQHGGLALLSLTANPFTEIAPGSSINVDLAKKRISDIFSLDPEAYSLKTNSGDTFRDSAELAKLGELIRFKYSYLFEKHDGFAVLSPIRGKGVAAIRKSVGKGSIYLLPAGQNQLNINVEHVQAHLESILMELQQKGKATVKSEIVAPEWTDKHLLFNEEKFVLSKNKLAEQKALIEQEIFLNEERLSEFRYLKRLLYAGDEPLEEVVETIFRGLGFNVVVPDGNNDDLNLIEDDFKAVVEIKGASKSGTTMHSMQLEKWISNYALENETELPKGILVLNPFRDLPPAMRKESPFPPDMLKYSIARNHCLMRSEDLLNLYLDFREKFIDKSFITTLLGETAGILTYHPKSKI